MAKASKKPQTNQDVYERITQRVLETMEARGRDSGDPLPWRSGLLGTRALMPPHNAFRGNRYQGTNFATLGLIGMMEGYRTHAWATFNQIKQHGGMVKKGERGIPLVTYFAVDKDAEGNTIRQQADESDEEYSERVADRLMVARTTRPVFNLDQADGLDQYLERYLDQGRREAGNEGHPMQHELLDQVEQRIEAMGIGLEHSQTPRTPVYKPMSHRIIVPTRDQFESLSYYAEALLHEGTHATMWDTGRVQVKEDVRALVQDQSAYAREELIAELGSLFMATRAGIEKDFANQASYIDGWGLKLQIQENPRLLFEAAAKAGSAAELVLDDDMQNRVALIHEKHGIGGLDFSEETMAALDEEGTTEAMDPERDTKSAETAPTP